MDIEQLLRSSKEQDFPDISGKVARRIRARRTWRRIRAAIGAAAALFLVAAVGNALFGISPHKCNGNHGILTKRDPTAPETQPDIPASPASASAPSFASAPSVPASADISAWLVSAQETGGAWNPARWGGKAEFGTAVSAIAVIALLENSSDPAAWQSVNSATTYFRAAQTPDGFIGIRAPDKSAGALPSSALASHALAASALLKAYQTGRFPELFTVVDGAVQFVRGAQSSSGVWCADASVNECLASVLATASELGWSDNAGHFRRARAALGGVLDSASRYDWLSSSTALRAGGKVLSESLSALRAAEG
jgi:hypothetical protein